MREEVVGASLGSPKGRSWTDVVTSEHGDPEAIGDACQKGSSDGSKGRSCDLLGSMRNTVRTRLIVDETFLGAFEADK